MADGALPKPPGRVRGRPFEKGRSGNPAGRRTGSCNRTTAAAAMRLCIERVLPACRERAVKFALPPIDSAADIAAAIKAVTSALAEGAITPGEAATIAAVVDTVVRAIETSDFRPAAPVHGGRLRWPGEGRAACARQLLGEVSL